MQPNTQAIKCSVEELAVMLSMLGRPEAAGAMLETSLGSVDEAGLHARLSAAGHSLIARGWLEVDLAQHTSKLAHAVAGIVEFLIHSEFSIRYSRTAPGGERTLAFHVQGKETVEHRVEDGVVHGLSPLPKPQEVIERGLDFLGLERIPALSGPTVEMTQQAVDQLKTYAYGEPATLLSFIQQSGVSAPWDGRLAEDLQAPEYWGSILRIEYESSGRLRSDRGAMLLKGRERLWLFHTETGESQVKVRLEPGSVQRFREEVQRLMKSAAQ